MLPLVFPNGDNLSIVQQNIGRLQHRIHEQARIDDRQRAI